MDQAEQSMADKFDDDDYPAYTMGRAAEMLGTTPGFLRSLDEAKLITPQRSPVMKGICVRRSRVVVMSSFNSVLLRCA